MLRDTRWLAVKACAFCSTGHIVGATGAAQPTPLQRAGGSSTAHNKRRMKGRMELGHNPTWALPVLPPRAHPRPRARTCGACRPPPSFASLRRPSSAEPPVPQMSARQMMAPKRPTPPHSVRRRACSEHGAAPTRSGLRSPRRPRRRSRCRRRAPQPRRRPRKGRPTCSVGRSRPSRQRFFGPRIPAQCMHHGHL